MIFQWFYIFDKGNQNESKKHKLLEDRSLFTKTHLQDSLFRINLQDVFFKENDRRTFDFIENDIFLTHMLKIQKRWKKKMKNIASERLAGPSPRSCSFFNCRLNVSCNYDTLLMQTNLKLVLCYMKNMKSLLDTWLITKVNGINFVVNLYLRNHLDSISCEFS